MNLAKPLLLAAITIAPATAPSDGDKPQGAKSMLQIVTTLEEQGYTPFVEVSFDDGRWEVEAYKGNASVELTVDPTTGEILGVHRDEAERRPPKGSLSLSELLQRLEKNRRLGFEEASFERRYWEIEIHRDGAKYELYVDPETAEIVSERVDD
jgi:hypothetical protein